MIRNALKMLFNAILKIDFNMADWYLKLKKT